MAKHDDAPKKDAKGREPAKPLKTPSSGKVRRPTPDPDDDESFVDVDDPAAAYLDAAVKTTPWWVLSLAFHGLVLASLPLIIFSHKFLTDETRTVEIHMRPQAVAKLELPERQRGFFDTAGLPGEVVNPDAPKVYFPNAEDSDHYESADGEDYGQIKGTSLEEVSHTGALDGGFKGRRPGGPGSNDSIGVGGLSGQGGSYGGPHGGRFNKRIRGQLGATTATESAVTAGLRWLARHQSQDGSWSAASFDAQCKGPCCKAKGYSEFDVGVTGLAVLAFLGAGYTPGNRASTIDPVTGVTLRWGETVRKGLQYLIDHENADGLVGPKCAELMYNHSIAAFALSEAYGLTNAVVYRAPAQKAISYLMFAQNENPRGTGRLGWRYVPRCGENDVSVTGWCVMALKSAQISGLDVSQSSFEGAKQFIIDMTNADGRVGYKERGNDDVVAASKNEAWASHRAMTAIGILSRIFIDRKKGDADMAKGAKLLMGDMPRWDPHADKQNPIDFYHWYYATYALNQYDGSNTAKDGLWTRWNKCAGELLCNTQCTKKDGCADGSWPAEHDRWGYAGGRVYGTAINVLTLEVYYRYASVFCGEKRSDSK